MRNFNHAPAKERRKIHIAFTAICYFNPTLPRRERHRRVSISRAGSTISIHAPAKGATFVGNEGLSLLEFSTTLPRGSDRSPARLRPIYSYFNHARRNDNAQVDFFCGKQDFNHAPAKGATRAYGRSSRQRLHFNPRSREGSDVHFDLRRLLGAISIHAPAKGATE